MRRRQVRLFEGPALKSPIRDSLCSRRYSLIESIRSWRGASRSAKSDTFRGRSFCAEGGFRSAPSSSARNGSAGCGNRCSPPPPSSVALPAYSGLWRGLLPSVWHPKNKIPERTLLCQQPAELSQERWRPLLEKREPLFMGARTNGVAGVQDNRHVRNRRTDHARKFESRFSSGAPPRGNSTSQTTPSRLSR